MGPINAVVFLFLGGFVLSHSSYAQDPTIDLNKVYADDTHCLVALEIRNDNDKPISCYCRDALADVWYMYRAYLGKDENLYGPIFALETFAHELCGEHYKGSEADKRNWKWNGPEVTRVYPPDEIAEHIAPDDKGWRTVQYQVILTYRDQKGHVTKTEQVRGSVPIISRRQARSALAKHHVGHSKIKHQ
jgi:hypothetical protein